MTQTALSGTARRAGLAARAAAGATPTSCCPNGPSPATLDARGAAGREGVRAAASRPDGVADRHVSAFLDAGGALEATARALFVHANTVRYRLRRIAEMCGYAPTDPRGALALRRRAAWDGWNTVG